MSIKQIHVIRIYDDEDTEFLGDLLGVELWVDGALVMCGNYYPEHIVLEINGFLAALNYLEVGYVKQETNVADTERANNPTPEKPDA